MRSYSRSGLLRYKIAPKCLLPGPFGHFGVGGNPGMAGTVRSYNLVFTYPCQRACGEIAKQWSKVAQLIGGARVGGEIWYRK